MPTIKGTINTAIEIVGLYLIRDFTGLSFPIILKPA
ncbi:MAG: hypothetical protein AMDU4_FER2C00142G0002, partial [Ferroplasma sp. Type II]